MYTTFEGFTLNGNSVVEIASSHYCGIKRCTFTLNSSSFWVRLTDSSSYNRVSYCEFGPGSGKHYIFPTGRAGIPGVSVPRDRTEWAMGRGPVNPTMARHTLIDHNYLHDKARGSGEAIGFGGLGMTGDYQEIHTIVEYNLLENCNGDAEIIAMKASCNTFRYNTVRTSSGLLSSRAGYKNEFYGNFILQNRRGGGLKINEWGHLIYNNYFENISDYAFLLENGYPYDASGFVHARCTDIKIVNNIFITGGRGVLLGHGGGSLPPNNNVFANNILINTSFNRAGSQNTTYAQNFCQGNVPSINGFLLVNQQLTSSGGIQRLSAGSPAIDAAQGDYPFVADDIDGQRRGDGKKDVGPDEYYTGAVLRGPLTPQDVGPDAEEVPTGIWVKPLVKPAPAATNRAFKLLNTGSGSIGRGMPADTKAAVYDITGRLVHKTMDYGDLMRIEGNITSKGIHIVKVDVLKR
jgi:hypothetical protein